MESYIFGGHRLSVYLSILFYLFIKFGCVPDNLSLAVIVPLVKCKSGDITDINNYRAITLPNSLSKLFEYVLLNLISTNDNADDYQFGFKKKHSTGLCTWSQSSRRLLQTER